MAVTALIFGTDDFYPQLKPFYDLEVQHGNLEIVGYAQIENNGSITLHSKNGGGEINFQIAIISSRYNFYYNMKCVENLGIPQSNIVDGKIFMVNDFALERFLATGIGYGTIEDTNSFILHDLSVCYPRVYSTKDRRLTISLGKGSNLGGAKVELHHAGSISVGNFSDISWNQTFELAMNAGHNHHFLSSHPMCEFGVWPVPFDWLPLSLTHPASIIVGNDVWIGRGCILKSMNPARPLTIGDGAVIASDSVVVKSVPPYAIVGGYPAQIIKYRFPEDIIEALMRIRWWDWDIDKIYENFKYFNRVEEFVALHDK